MAMDGRSRAALFALSLLVSVSCTRCHQTPAAATTAIVREGNARFQVLGNGLVRLEYADDGAFEDGLSFNVVNRDFPLPRYTTRRQGGWREVETDAFILRYRAGSGPFGADNLTVQIKVLPGGAANPFNSDHSVAPSEGNLGGWLRALDGQGAPQPLHDGLLSRRGWYLLDDSQTALWTSEGWVTGRRPRARPYQDGYLFVYGHDYPRALSDLAGLTGPAPLLPRWAFGVWFSRFWAYSFDDYRNVLLPRFRSEQVPLDVLVADTNWRIDWDWNPALFTDGQAFLEWAKGQGLHISLNIHPAITATDSHFAATKATAGELYPANPRAGVFGWDWGNPQQARSYFSLHEPFDRQGNILWWFDWCCDGNTVSVAGVPPDTWINHLYAQRMDQRGARGFAFSRVGSYLAGYGQNLLATAAGAWAEHRYTMQFTGDTAPTWDILRFEADFTVGAGNIGLPYVSHDIGSFGGTHLADDLYVRWVQFGTFQPIFRVHSNHGDRLPWDYGDAVRVAAESFFRLREALIPFYYTLARLSHDSGMPIVRGLYLAYPEHDEAYRFTHQYMLGDSVLVAPITQAGTTATTQVWFPPGQWVDFFTGDLFRGPATREVAAGFDRMPVYIKAGGIVPMQPAMSFEAERPVDPLLLKIGGGDSGQIELYEDGGDGAGYRGTALRRTPMRYLYGGAGMHTVRIGPARGAYDGMITSRAYQVDLANTAPVNAVTVNGVQLRRGADIGWQYDPLSRTLRIHTERYPTDQEVTIACQ